MERVPWAEGVLWVSCDHIAGQIQPLTVCLRQGHHLIADHPVFVAVPRTRRWANSQELVDEDLWHRLAPAQSVVGLQDSRPGWRCVMHGLDPDNQRTPDQLVVGAHA